MAAGDRIYAVRSVEGCLAATHVVLDPSTVVVEDPGPADGPGPADFLVTRFDLGVTIYGEDEAELLALVGAEAADRAIGVAGQAGADEIITVHDLYLDEVVGEMLAPAQDAGGKVSEIGVKGRVNWADGETFADKLTAA